jgi:hypothetical protein
MVSGVVILITMQSSKGSYFLYFAIRIDSLFFTLTAAAGSASVPIREPSRFWRDPVLGGSDAVGLASRSPLTPMPANTNTAAAIAMGEVDILAGLLATADATATAAKAESDRLRGLIVARMQDAGVKTYKTAWGSMTIKDSVTYGYTQNVAVAEINLRAMREVERKTGAAEIATSKKVLAVTYSK